MRAHVVRSSCGPAWSRFPFAAPPFSADRLGGTDDDRIVVREKAQQSSRELRAGQVVASERPVFVVVDYLLAAKRVKMLGHIGLGNIEQVLNVGDAFRARSKRFDNGESSRMGQEAKEFRFAAGL